MREPSVAFALNRKSRWPKCCLWEEDLREIRRANPSIKFSVALSRRDCFFDTALVSAYLATFDFPAECFSQATYDCTHGEMIFNPSLLVGVVKHLNTVITPRNPVLISPPHTTQPRHHAPIMIIP